MNCDFINRSIIVIGTAVSIACIVIGGNIHGSGLNNKVNLGWELKEDNKWYHIEDRTPHGVVYDTTCKVIDGKEYSFNPDGSMKPTTVAVYDPKYEDGCNKIVQTWKNEAQGDYYSGTGIEVDSLEEASRLSKYMTYNYLTYGDIKISAKSKDNGKYEILVWMRDSLNKADKHIQSDKIIENKVSSILKKGLGTNETAMELMRWIRENIEYDINSNDVYSGLVNKKTACHGYAVLAVRTLRKAGIPCEYELGYMGGMFHGWNKVELNGVKYYVDLSSQRELGLSEALFSGYVLSENVGYTLENRSVCKNVR